MEPIFPLHYLPSIAWFQQALQFDSIQLEVSEHFVKQSYRSRCRILSANGIQVLSIPVIQPSGQKIQLSEAQLDNSFSWNHQHWQSLVSAYGKSAYFLYYKDELERLYAQPGQSLQAFNTALINYLLKAFKVKLELNPSAVYRQDYPSNLDFRNHFNAKNPSPENELRKPLKYWQVFEEKYGFTPNLSAVDLLFNLGPEAGKMLS